MEKQDSYADILEAIGFERADALGMHITWSPDPNDRGGFYRGDFAGIQNTVGVDENGRMWLKAGHVDLAPYGFHDISKPAVQ